MAGYSLWIALAEALYLTLVEGKVGWLTPGDPRRFVPTGVIPRWKYTPFRSDSYHVGKDGILQEM